MKALLVGNYQGDRQWSMERFCAILERGLRDEGIEVEVVRPAVKLGRLCGAGRVNKWLGYADKFVFFRAALRRAAGKDCVVHVVDQGNGIYAGWLSGRCVVTCHDLLAIRAARGEFAEQRVGWSGRVLQSMILRGLRRVKGLVSVSRATRGDVAHLIGESEVIANGIEEFWAPMNAAEAWREIERAGVASLARQAGFVLHVGGNQWYKNRAGVVSAFIELRKGGDSPRLLMAGPELDSTLRAQLKEAGLDQEVTVLSDVSDETLRALYSAARVFLFPSIEEGFGWPILEAQACGCPVVTTRKEPMRETGGDAAICPADENWTGAIAEVLGMDESRRAALVAAGIGNAGRYTVKKMARQYIEFYQRHLSS